MNHYRPLSAEEIKQLQQQGCQAEDWTTISVDPSFDASFIHTTIFSGFVQLGHFLQKHTEFESIPKSLGIRNAHIHNCKIGNNVRIYDVHNHIANYLIEDNVFIENIDSITASVQATFGYGTKVAVINEGGGREIPLSTNLSAPIAYTIATHRHDQELINRLEEIISKESVGAAIISSGSIIINSKEMKDVCCKGPVRIEGCTTLCNGTILSDEKAPVYIGRDVIARDFILAEGCQITDGALIERCYVGQATELGKQFSATDSVFFCNCQGFHGEACSLFAGPYTVSHHKSTLLIASLFSFMNAGSNSNQSNHLYKLGPLHQGITGRGCKTASSSHVIWPAKVGSFSLLMGHVYTHPNTEELPFSYLIGTDKETYLIPAVALRSAGTMRDVQKWPKRDKRKGKHTDPIHFSLLNPYTANQIIKGIQVLSQLNNEHTEDLIHYKGVIIKKSSIDRGITLYQTCLKKYIGECIIKRLAQKKGWQCNTPIGAGQWLDLAGLLLPISQQNSIIEEIKENRIQCLTELNNRFWEIYNNYDEYEWRWLCDYLLSENQINLEMVSSQELKNLLDEWKVASLQLNQWIKEDALKDFSSTSKIGFGITDQLQQDDFDAVRGTEEENSFLQELDANVSVIENTHQKISQQILL